MDNTEIVWLLIARCLSHEATEREHQELALHLEKYPEIAAQYLMLKELWNKESDLNHDLPRGWQEFSN